MKRFTSLLALLVVVSAHLAARTIGDGLKWGYAPNDYSKLTTISYLTTPGTYGEGMRVKPAKEWADGTIEGVSVPVALTSMKNLRCLVATDEKFYNVIAEINVPDGTLKKGYNDIAFDDPIAVPSKDFYVGYTYTIAESGASLMVYDTKADGGLYLYLGSWMDYSPYGMGVSGLQVIIGSQQLEEYGVEFRSVEWPNVVCGETSVRAIVRSSSKHPVEAFDYAVTIGGERQTGTIVLDTPLPEGMGREMVVDVPFTAPAEAVPFEAVLSVEAVGGAANVEPDGPLTVQLNAVTRRVARRSVVEEFTGTKCGYCPKGWVGMETMKANRSDSFIGIAIHQYNNDDPMYCGNYARLPFVGAPSCLIDRGMKEAIDPYNGSGHFTTILGDFDAANALLPDVAVDLDALMAEDGKSVTVAADVEFLGQADGYTLGYVLTADGLTGTGPWLQTNYYYEMTPSAVINGALPELSIFCKGGEKGQNLTSMVFGDVLIASSWNAAGSSLAPALPAHAAAGERHSAAYTLALPTGKTLLNALDRNQIYAVVLVVDSKGRIANAARRRVDTLTSVASTPVSTTAPQVYGLDGRRVTPSGSSAHHGIVIERSADGRVRRVVR